MAHVMDVGEEEIIFENEVSTMLGERKRKKFVNMSVIICYRCQKQGHYQFECPGLKKEANYDEFD